MRAASQLAGNEDNQELKRAPSTSRCPTLTAPPSNESPAFSVTFSSIDFRDHTTTAEMKRAGLFQGAGVVLCGRAEQMITDGVSVATVASAPRHMQTFARSPAGNIFHRRPHRTRASQARAIADVDATDVAADADALVDAAPPGDVDLPTGTRRYAAWSNHMTVELILRIETSGDRNHTNNAAAEEREMRVALAERWIRYVNEAGRQIVLDFDRRRRLEIDAASRAYFSGSLFDVVGFRHMELPNRAHIRAVLEAGKDDPSEFTPVLDEHRLAVGDPSRRTTVSHGAVVATSPAKAFVQSLFGTQVRWDIEAKTSDTQVVYSTRRRPLLSHSRDGFNTPEGVHGFVQFVRYRHGGHPLILARLCELGTIPREVRLYGLAPPGLGTSEVSIRVDDLRPSNADFPDISSLRAVPPFDSSDPIDDILTTAKQRMRPAECGHEELLLAEAASLLLR